MHYVTVNVNLFNKQHLGKVDALLNHLLVFLNELLMSRQLPLGLVSVLRHNTVFHSHNSGSNQVYQLVSWLVFVFLHFQHKQATSCHRNTKYIMYSRGQDKHIIKQCNNRLNQKYHKHSSAWALGRRYLATIRLLAISSSQSLGKYWQLK